MNRSINATEKKCAKKKVDLVQQQVVTGASLFAGMGGFVRAMTEAGIDVKWANEKDAFAVRTFKHNFPDVRCIPYPIEEVTIVGDDLVPVDILTAGFPCQPFSIAGYKKGFNDERGQLFLHIIRLLKEFGPEKPKILLLENVKNFRDHDKGRTFQRVQVEIQKAGYWFSDKDARVLNTMTHTDIPQNRERIFMVAFNADVFPSNVFCFPQPWNGNRRRELKEFFDFEKQAEPEAYFKPGDTYYPHFEEAIANGDPDAVYLLRRSYVRQNKSGVCFTLMASMGEGGHNHPVIRDPWGIRKLSVRECARLQGFRDEWFKIPPDLSRSQLSKQIGNTVTVPLAIKLLEECVIHIRRARLKQPEEGER